MDSLSSHLLGTKLNQHLGLDEKRNEGINGDFGTGQMTSQQPSEGPSTLGQNMYYNSLLRDDLSDSKAGIKSSTPFNFSPTSSYNPSSSSTFSSLSGYSAFDPNKGSQMSPVNNCNSSQFMPFNPNMSSDFVNNNSYNNTNTRYTYSAPQEQNQSQNQRKMSASSISSQSFSSFSPSNQQYIQPSPIGTNFSYTDYNENNANINSINNNNSNICSNKNSDNNNSGPTSPINNNFSSINSLHSGNIHANYMRPGSSFPQQKLSAGNSKLTLSATSSSNLPSLRGISSSSSSSVNSFISPGNSGFKNTNDISFSKSFTSPATSVWGPPPQTPPGLSLTSSSSSPLSNFSTLSGTSSNTSTTTTNNNNNNSQYYLSSTTTSPTSYSFYQDSQASINRLPKLTSFNSVKSDTNFGSNNNSHVGGGSLGGSRSAGDLNSRYQFSNSYSGTYNNEKVNSSVPLPMVSETDIATTNYTNNNNSNNNNNFNNQHEFNYGSINNNIINTNNNNNTDTNISSNTEEKKACIVQAKQVELLISEVERLKKILGGDFLTSSGSNVSLISKERMFRQMVKRLDESKMEIAKLKLKTDVNNVIFNSVEGELTVEQRIHIDDTSKLLVKKMTELQEENEILGVSFYFIYLLFIYSNIMIVIENDITRSIFSI